MPVLTSSLFSKRLQLKYNVITEQKMEKYPSFAFSLIAPLV